VISVRNKNDVDNNRTQPLVCSYRVYDSTPRLTASEIMSRKVILSAVAAPGCQSWGGAKGEAGGLGNGSPQRGSRWRVWEEVPQMPKRFA